MAITISVQASQRDTRGKNEARRLRAAGQIPAVLYGAFKDPVAVSVSPKEINQIMRSKSGHNTLFNVVLDGESTPVMIVDWQLEPIRDSLLHVDLKRIDLAKKLRVSIPVLVHGDPKGVKIQGGLLELVSREVEIECLPNDIPDHFDMEVTELMLNQSVRASDIALPETMKLVSSADAVIAHVVALRAEEETTTAEAAPAEGAAPAAAGSEPEVIKKGKKEEEAEAETKKKK